MSQASSAMDSVQEHLNTGKSVNSATDNPLKFFTASTLQYNAIDMSKLKDNIGQAVQALETTMTGLNSIQTTLNTMQGLINSANGAGGVTATLQSLVGQYIAMQTQITNLAGDSSYNGVNLINTTSTASTYDLTVQFGIGNLATTSTYTILSIGSTAASLGLVAPTTWATAGDMAGSQTLLTAALATVRATINTFATQISMLQTRQEFTNQYVKSLQDGASALVDADKNEEAAKLNSLKMTEYVGISNLGTSQQLQQSILKLLG